jgi:hypothetical protein
MNRRNKWKGSFSAGELGCAGKYEPGSCVRDAPPSACRRHRKQGAVPVLLTRGGTAGGAVCVLSDVSVDDGLLVCTGVPNVCLRKEREAVRA